MDHYQTLGIARNATTDDIKKAYRRLAGIHHPDKGGDTAEFQKVQQAYEILSDPQKKQEYDNPNPFGAQGGMHGMHGFPGGGGFSFTMNGFDVNDIFGQMFGQQQRGNFKPPPPSYRTTVFITLAQVYHGGEHSLQLNDHNGIKNIKVTIPKGVENGQILRYDNLIKDAILMVEFRVTPDYRFERDGPNLYSTQEVSIFDLVVGSKFEFEVISGKKVEVVIPPKTQPNAKLRVSGEGLPIHNTYGDQFILLKPYIPDIIDSRITDAILETKDKT